MDPIERSKLTAKAQQMTNQELPWLPLLEIPNAAYMSDRVTGMSPSINFMYYQWGAQLGAR